MAIDALPVVTGNPLSGVTYFCTTRQGGVSPEPWGTLNLGLHTSDVEQRVHENRRRLQAMLPGTPVWLNQVHGTQVFDADLPHEPSIFPPEADAAVTTRPCLPLVIMTADCLPVVIASSEGLALGVAHAGWRGLAAGVLEDTLKALQAKVNGQVSWHAWIGPAISQPYFEVGADVFNAFSQHDPATHAYFSPTIPGMKWLADLPGLARHRLERAGVATVECSGLCTYSATDTFYSYRRQSQTGRLVTAAWLEAP